MTQKKSQAITIRAERIRTLDTLVYTVGLERRPDVPLKRRHFVHALIDLLEDGTFPKEIVIERALKAADTEYVASRPELKIRAKKK